jgi:hypothetical protein
VKQIFRRSREICVWQIGTGLPNSALRAMRQRLVL